MPTEPRCAGGDGVNAARAMKFAIIRLRARRCNTRRLRYST